MYSLIENDWPRWEPTENTPGVLPSFFDLAPDFDTDVRDLGDRFWSGHELSTPTWAHDVLSPSDLHAPLVLDIDAGEVFASPSGEGVNVMAAWDSVVHNTGPAEVLFFSPTTVDDRPFAPQSPLPEPPIDTPQAWVDMPMEWSGLSLDALGLECMVDFGALALTT